MATKATTKLALVQPDLEQMEAADLALLAHVTDIDDALALYPQRAE